MERYNFLSSFASHPQRGEIIYAKRKNGAYLHYGVYVGDNQVIHFSYHKNETINDTRIIKTSLQEFADGDTVYIENEQKSVIQNTNEECAQKAEMMIEAYKHQYNLAFNNCEHFVNLCKYNQKESKQVSKCIQSATSVAVQAAFMHLNKTPIPIQYKIPLLIGEFVLKLFIGNQIHSKQSDMVTT